jgi:hypothetical protein
LNKVYTEGFIMAKAGKVDGITEKDASFEGSGVEGQKDAATDAATDPAPEDADADAAPTEESASPESFTEDTSSVITLRDGKCQRLYFRGGKEIGSEDV